MGCSSFQTKSHTMSVPPLYRQLQAQLSQWITPKDQRHLQVLLRSSSYFASSKRLSEPLVALSEPSQCEARSHMERLSYFVHNPKIDAENLLYPAVAGVSKRHGREPQ